jgi:hypothetical protein
VVKLFAFPARLRLFISVLICGIRGLTPLFIISRSTLKSHRGKWPIKPKPGVQISHFEGYGPRPAVSPKKLRKPPSLQAGNAIYLNQICNTLHISKLLCGTFAGQRPDSYQPRAERGTSAALGSRRVKSSQAIGLPHPRRHGNPKTRSIPPINYQLTLSQLVWINSSSINFLAKCATRCTFPTYDHCGLYSVNECATIRKHRRRIVFKHILVQSALLRKPLQYPPPHQLASSTQSILLTERRKAYLQL